MRRESRHLVIALVPALFYFQPEGNLCHWTILSAGDGKVERVHSTPSCPDHLVWEPGAKRAWYTVGNDLYEHSWGEGGRPKLRARVPFRILPDAPWHSRLRVSAERGTIRVAFLEPVAVNDVIRRGERSYFRRSGRLHDGESASNIGIPYFAVVWDLEAGGQWKEIAAIPTSWEAGDTLGLAVVSGPMKSRPGTYALDEISMSALRTREWDSARLAVEGRRAQEITRTLAAGEDGFGYLEWTAGTGIVFPIVVGDTPHASSPIHCCRDACVEMLKLQGLPESPDHREVFSLQFAGEYLLVAPERLTSALVYDACTPEPVRSVSGVEWVHWLPFDPGWLKEPPSARVLYLASVIGPSSQPGTPSKCMAHIEPILEVSRGRLSPAAVPGEGQMGPDDYRRYLPRGRSLRVLRGGAEAGRITIGAPEHVSCVSLMARGEVEGAIECRPGELLLATGSPAIGSSRTSRRVLSEDDTRRVRARARDRFEAGGQREDLAKGGPVTVRSSLSADLDGDGHEELVASAFFVVAPPRGDDRTHEVAFVLEGGALHDLWSYAGDSELGSRAHVVDHVDLDGDGASEIVLRIQHYESWEFAVFRRVEGRWVKVYSGGGGGC